MQLLKKEFYILNSDEDKPGSETEKENFVKCMPMVFFNNIIW